MPVSQVSFSEKQNKINNRLRRIKTSHCPSHTIHDQLQSSYGSLYTSSSVFKRISNSPSNNFKLNKRGMSVPTLRNNYNYNGSSHLNLYSPSDASLTTNSSNATKFVGTLGIENIGEKKEQQQQPIDVKQHKIDTSEEIIQKHIDDVQVIMSDPNWELEDKKLATWTVFPPPSREVYKSNFSPWPARQYIKESDTNGTSTVVFGSSMILQDD